MKQKSTDQAFKPGTIGVLIGKSPVPAVNHEHCYGHEYMFSQSDYLHVSMVIPGTAY